MTWMDRLWDRWAEYLNPSRRASLDRLKVFQDQAAQIRDEVEVMMTKAQATTNRGRHDR